MQTFLPYEDFAESAAALDDKRLGKQRVEVKQILEVLNKIRIDELSARVDKLNLAITLQGPSAPERTASPPRWANHPAVLMWKDHEGLLVQYGLAVCYEWKRVRGFQDSIQVPLLHKLDAMRKQKGFRDSFLEPWWLGDERFHGSHRFNLHRKDPEHYADFWGEAGYTCCLTCDYFWPSHLK